MEVYKRSTGSWLEDQDFWRFSGIFREVYLYSIPKTHIQDIFIKTDLDKAYKNALLKLDLKVEGELNTDIDLELRDKEGNLVGKSRGNVVAENMSLELSVKDVELWSAESPYLYTLHIVIRDERGR